MVDGVNELEEVGIALLSQEGSEIEDLARRGSQTEMLRLRNHPGASRHPS